MNTYRLRKCPTCNEEYVSEDKYCPKCKIDTEQPYTVTYYPTDDSTDSTDSDCWSIYWNTRG